MSKKSCFRGPYLNDFVFPKSQTPKKVVRKMSKKSCFRGPFDKQHRKRAQALLKSALHNLYHIHRSLPRKLSRKNSLFETCKVLGLLVNTLAANEKYLFLHRNNLTIPIQMQLSEKQKTFSKFFAAFLKSRLNFRDFEYKDGPHRICIFEVCIFPKHTQMNV